MLMLAGALIAVLVDGSPASATPPTISSFTASLSDVNLVTLSWATTGGDPSNGLYIYDLTNEANVVGFQPLSGTMSFRVTRIGLHRYGLDVRNTAGETMSAKTSLTVNAAFAAPVVLSANPIRIDNLVPTTPTFTWFKQSTATSRLTTGFSTLDLKDSGTFVGSYTPPAFAYTPGTGVGSATTTWFLSQCTHGADASALLCSQPATLTIVDGPARVISPGARANAAPGQNVTFSWNPGGSGAFYNLASNTTGFNLWTTSNSASVTIPSTASGLIDFTLTECAAGLCNNRYDPVSPVAGTITSITPLNTIVGPPSFFVTTDVVAQVQTSDGTIVDVNTEPLMGQTAGKMGFPDTNPATNQPFRVGDTIAANTRIAFVITDDQAHADHVQIMASPQTWTTKAYTTDFTVDPAQDRWPAWQDPNLGPPIWVQQAPNGDIYGVGEFSRSLSQMSAGESVSAHDVPLLRVNTTVGSTTVRQQVTPFTYTTPTSKVAFSVFTEQDAVDASGKVWFAQGGGAFPFNAQTLNHSRVMSFDPAGTDDPATVDDERVCAYNVPATGTAADGTNLFNSGAFGVAAVGDRVYFVEARPGQESTLTWFVPSEFPLCNTNNGANNNYFDFDATPPLSSTPGYCNQPSDTGCFHAVTLPGSSYAAYPFYDGAANAIWIGEFFTAGLYKYDIGSGAVTKYQLNVVRRPAAGAAILGDIDTGLAVDANYVYFLGAVDVSVNRFNKAQAALGGCEQVDANGNNPCVQQIFLPFGSNEAGGNQMSLANGKLWFALGHSKTWFDPASPTVGFVNTNNWGPGTIYTGLENAGDPARHTSSPSLFGIIALPSGAVLVTDYYREEVLRLWPNGVPR
jgi:hypothetical protein